MKIERRLHYTKSRENIFYYSYSIRIDAFRRKSYKYGNHAEEIYCHKFMWSKLDYNSVRAVIVEKDSNYKYSSASNYVNNEGLITIENS